MRNLLTIILTLITLISFGQNKNPKELGIGLTIATNPYEFETKLSPKNLYINKELTQKWNTSNVFPFFYKPDYGLYHFICLEQTKDYYKILVNDTTIGYLSNDSTFYFKTWEVMLLQSTVERLSNDNPIRKECNNQCEIIINKCEFERLDVIDVIQKDGEFWIQINFSSDCEEHQENNPNVKSGWLKWRTKERLLVDFLLLC